MHLDGNSGALADRSFRELPSLVGAGDVLVMNDTRVINARMTGRKASGGQIEVLIERVLDSTRALAQVRASKSPRAGTRLLLDGDAVAEVLGRAGEFYELRFINCPDIFALIERAGSVEEAVEVGSAVAAEIGVAAPDGIRATLLLSPIGSSFDMYNNPFGARGEAFRAAVLARAGARR